MTNRDIGAELLEAVREIKRGGGRRYEVEVPRDVPTIRQRTGLSQSAFAALLGSACARSRIGNRAGGTLRGRRSRSCALPIGTRGRWSGRSNPPHTS